MKNIIAIKAAFYQGIILTSIIIGAFSCNNAQKPEDSKAVAEEHNDAKFNDKSSEKDAQFLVNAAEINLQEIELGKLAQHNSMMNDVAKLGKMLEQAHTKSLNDLMALAKKKQITIPTEPTDKAKDAYKSLSTKAGIDFDKSYSNMMADGHKDAVAKFEKASTECSDEDIKQWAASMLPELRKHLDQAIVCQKKYNSIK